jgi:hypothetical protein
MKTYPQPEGMADRLCVGCLRWFNPSPPEDWVIRCGGCYAEHKKRLAEIKRAAAHAAETLRRFPERPPGYDPELHEHMLKGPR